jgi:hypothetical protein
MHGALGGRLRGMLAAIRAVLNLLTLLIFGLLLIIGFGFAIGFYFLI